MPIPNKLSELNEQEGIDEKKNKNAKVISMEEKKKEMIERKKQELIERCEKLISYVDRRYEKSSIAENVDELREFKNHIRQILDLAIEEGIERNVSEKELDLIAVVASLHDIAKGDNPPEEMDGIDNVMVVLHGELAAKEVAENEELKEIIKSVIGEENFNKESIQVLQNAFRSHMGPSPGFMKNILDDVNKKLTKRGLAEIKHPFPEEGAIVSEILLTADMYSLASPSGVRKVLEIRSVVPSFKEEDMKLSEEYSFYRINLSLGEAALISAFESGKSARDMFKKKEDQDFLQKAINESESQGFQYNSEEGGITEVSPSLVKEKMIAYKEAREQNNAREKINRVA